MSLINRIKRLFITKKELNVLDLPSQGYFYKPDFKIFIKRASKEDIIDYESDYDSEDLSIILKKLKSIVEKNVTLSKKYTFSQIKSIDIVYIFLEIVKLTKNKKIKIKFYNEDKSENDFVIFDKKNFNYFKIPDHILDTWNKEERIFDINGYKYSLPSIGIENILTKFLISKSYDENALDYNDYNYDFTFFLGNRDTIDYNEIDNLIQIFNFDISEDEYEKIDDIIVSLLPMQVYSLKKDGMIIDMSAKIKLEDIWK